MSQFTVRFWGTRGSIPTPGRNTEKYGGNTTCLELRFEDTIILLDAGSGIRPVSLAWFQEFGDRPIQAHLLFTHLHWDHIQGFPFFTAAYLKQNALTIYGESRPDGGIRELLSGQMRGSYFPVPLAAMQAALTFKDTAPEFDIGPVAVRTASLPHPGGCLGYRLEAGGGVLVFATDSELDQVALNKEAVRANQLTPRQYDPEFLRFFSNASVLVIDCQYTDAEYQQKRGWGHNSVAAVVDLCAQVCPKMAVLFHHDPESDDEKVTAIADETSNSLELLGCSDTLVLAARERMTLEVRKPLRPLLLPTAGSPAVVRMPAGTES